MTPDETIEQQARREAEAKYPRDFYTHQVMREAYAAALIAERYKPQPSVDEVMEVVNDEAWTARDRIEDDPMSGIDDHLVKMASNVRDRLTKMFKP